MKQELNFQTLFEALPHLVLVLSTGPEFIMLAANEGRLRGTNTRREDCIGRSIFEVFERIRTSEQSLVQAYYAPR